MLAGYRAAAKRYHAGRLTQDFAATYHPLFEALNWAVALDQQAGARWSPRGGPLGSKWRDEIVGGDHVDAVRFARNRAHHQWADALVLSEGFAFPITFPLVTHEWAWRPSTDLPKGKNDSGRLAYDRLLANRPARFSLQQLDETYAYVADLLERPGA